MRKTPLEEGQRWLEQAEADLKWAGLLAEQGGYHLACFHAQQVAGMALKAFLYAQGEEIVLGHSVERLCNSAATHDPGFGEKVKSWSVLAGYYMAGPGFRESVGRDTGDTLLQVSSQPMTR